MMNTRLTLAGYSLEGRSELAKGIQSYRERVARDALSNT
jgi:hypothetical protein